MTDNCENCVFAKSFPKVAQPMDFDEFWKKKTFWQRLFTDYKIEKWHYGVKNTPYKDYQQYVVCQRFPRFEKKNKNDVCGEHKPQLKKQ